MSECTVNWIQVIITVLTFIVFVGLALITRNYARDTKRMADIMSKEFELRYRPFVDLRIGLPFVLDDYSGFKIPLEVILLGEFPFTLTRLVLEIELGMNETRELLKLESMVDKIISKNESTYKSCVGPFADQRISEYFEKRKHNQDISELQIGSLYVYHKTKEGKEELFQRLPTPYRNYYELDKICSKGLGTVQLLGKRDIHNALEEF